MAVHDAMQEPRLATLATFSKLMSLGALSAVAFKYCLFRSKELEEERPVLPRRLALCLSWGRGSGAPSGFSHLPMGTYQSQEGSRVLLGGVTGFFSFPSCARFKVVFHRCSPVFHLASAKFQSATILSNLIFEACL